MQNKYQFFKKPLNKGNADFEKKYLLHLLHLNSTFYQHRWQREAINTHHHVLHGDQFEALVLKALDDFADESSLDTVRLDHKQRAFTRCGHGSRENKARSSTKHQDSRNTGFVSAMKFIYIG
jgi:hypothetical protein